MHEHPRPLERHTSTHGHSNTTLPYVQAQANRGFEDAIAADPSLARGVNTYRGRITYQAVAKAFGIGYMPLARALD